jgi:uncharacterized protein (DUF58 family)
MKSYIQPDVVARAQALGLKARSIVEGLRVGDHRSPFRGFSVEFVQHREYVPGDDIRHIDWKSYGRSERYTIKQYEQETNYAGTILLDASRSMIYGDGATNKLHYAKLLAATLAYAILHQRDSVALNVFSDGWRTILPASAQAGHLQTILRALVEAEPEENTAIGPLLNDLAGKMRRRGLVFLITDGLDDADSLLKGLQHLRFRGHEVTLFQVMHPDELSFPFDGHVRFLGLELPRELLTRPYQIRVSYLRVMQAHLDKLRRGCEAARADYVLMDTGKSLANTLAEHLARRLAVKL